MKIMVKGIEMECGAKKVNFQGAEIEMIVQEIALYFENVDKIQAAFDHMVEKSAMMIEKVKEEETIRHQHNMEYLEKQDSNDAAYQQRRAANDAAYHQMQLERENLSHQHWLEKYGKDEDETEDE